MSDLTCRMTGIPAMTGPEIDKIRRLESAALQMPQVDITTSHFLHAGTYVRTVRIPAGVLITGALIKIPTTLIVSGDVVVYIGSQTLNLTGYNVIPAQGNRKQAFLARSETWLTMTFATDAATVAEAEQEFTDEFTMLITRRNEDLCLE